MGASCDPDYHVMGMQNGEQIVNMLRLVALCISLSVFHPWLNPSRRQHMRIFFLHWTSGVAYVLSQFIMSVMVLNCWSSRRTAGPFIYFFKFVELTAVNLWAISSISIAIVITRIVQAFSQLRRVHSVVGSVQTVWRCTALAIALSCCSAPFWNDVMVTGAYFWVTHTGNEGFSRWISLSFLTTQAVAGFLMALILIFNVTGPRRTSLIVCCKTSKRVKIYFILTILGTCVYLYNGAVLFVDEFAVFRVGKKEMVMIGWCSKYIHVIADTFVLFSAFQAIDKRNVAVEDAGPRAQQSAGPSVGPSSSDHSRLTVPGPSWLCDSLPRTASGTHNNTGEIRSPASSASAGSLSSPTIPVGICDGEGNGAPSSPLPPRSAFGRLVAGVTGRSSKSAASWISGNGDSPRARGAAAVAELEQGDCDDGGGGDGDGGGGRCSQAEVQSAIASVGSCTINSHSSSNANIDSNSHASGNINSNSSNSHASSKTHASGNITTSSNINSNNSNSNSQRSNNTHNSNTNSNSSNNYSSNENTSNRRLNIFNFSETASKGSSRGDTPIGTAIGNSLNRPEISPCSLGPKAAPFSGGESSGTSSLRLTVQAGPPQREEDVESGWVGATELSTV